MAPIKVMIDGRSVAFRPTGGNWLGPELIPLSLVERVEVIRGPSSALYGADAFLGVVNAITRKGVDLSGADARVSMQHSATSAIRRDYDFAVGGRNGSWEFVVAGRLHEEDRSGLRLPETSPAPRVPEYRPGELVSRGSENSAEVAVGKATYHLNPRQSLSLQAQHSQFERGSEFSSWAHLPYGLDEQGRLHETRIALQQTAVGLISESTFGSSGGLTFAASTFPEGRPRPTVLMSAVSCSRSGETSGIELWKGKLKVVSTCSKGFRWWLVAK